MLRTEVREGNIRKSFVAVGRLDLKHKRQDLLIGAFNLISAKYPDYKLEIYGDGEDESKVVGEKMVYFPKKNISMAIFENSDIDKLVKCLRDSSIF